MNMSWIKKRLKSLGANQGDLAAAIGRDRAVVSRIIHGKQALSLDQIAAFAKVLQMPPEVLIERANLNGGKAGKAARPRIVVGISGATGVIFGIRLLDILRDLNIETHLVISRAGALTIAHETDMSLREIAAKSDVSYRIGDIAAPIASGSFRTEGMIIAPCSVHTFSEIATGVTSNLLTRAADVMLKERRKLVLMVRETPLHLGHLRSLAQLAEMGAIIAPPMQTFYTRPRHLDDMITHSLGRVLDLFNLELPGLPRWGDPVSAVP